MTVTGAVFLERFVSVIVTDAGAPYLASATLIVTLSGLVSCLTGVSAISLRAFLAKVTSLDFKVRSFFSSSPARRSFSSSLAASNLTSEVDSALTSLLARSIFYEVSLTKRYAVSA